MVIQVGRNTIRSAVSAQSDGSALVSLLDPAVSRSRAEPGFYLVDRAGWIILLDSDRLYGVWGLAGIRLGEVGGVHAYLWCAGL